MRNKMILLGVAAALSAPMAAQADDSPNVYGKVHVSYGTVDDGTTDNWQFRSHASRIGFKGKRDFGDGLTGFFKLEYEVSPDEDEADGSTILNRRNQYVGLKGGFGEVRIGRHDMPLKMSQGKFDQFGDTDADLKNAGDEDGENRLSNVLMYMGGSGKVKFNIALVAGEGDGTTAGDGPADTVGASISYKDGGLYLALATESRDDTGAAAGTKNSITRATGTYKTGDMQFGLMVQSGVENVSPSADEEDWIGVSFNKKFGGKNKFKLQYITVEDSQATKVESTLWGVGIDHKFDKKTTGYIMYSDLQEDQGGTTVNENTFFGVGMIYKF